eukprot:2949050-Lingulodinium_polyedra.AAC.1
MFARVVPQCVMHPKPEWHYLDEADMGVAAVMVSVSNPKAIKTSASARYRAIFHAEFWFYPGEQ